MIVIGLDPGTEQSTLVCLVNGAPNFAESGPNEAILERLDSDDLSRWWVEGQARRLNTPVVLAIEQVESFGMAVGKEVFETVFWSGRFAQAWHRRRFERMPRRIVKQHLCHTARATDANIRQAILDRFGGSSAVGTKKNPGPLYQIKGHAWAALAVALTFYDQQKDQPEQIRPGVAADF